MTKMEKVSKIKEPDIAKETSWRDQCVKIKESKRSNIEGYIILKLKK